MSQSNDGGEKIGMAMKISFYSLLGVYILTKSLIPLLEKSADPRVVSLIFQFQNFKAVKAYCIFNGSSLHPVKESKQPAFIGRFL